MESDKEKQVRGETRKTTRRGKVKLESDKERKVRGEERMKIK